MSKSLFRRLVERVSIALITLVDGPDAPAGSGDPADVAASSLPPILSAEAFQACPEDASAGNPFRALGMDAQAAEALMRKAQRALHQVLDEAAGNRVILPMSSGIDISPNESAQITSRPQNCAFRVERIVVHDAHDWVINDIKVGNLSQLAQSGDVPGVAFDPRTNDLSLRLDTCQPGMDFVLVVTYVGDRKQGEPFVCCAVGTRVEST